MSLTQLQYRPEIDGLRALAVLTVVFYHAALGLTGGYVGVDVFFVISGFLIISLITKELESGVFSPARFWERRARRIMPALIFMVGVTLLAGWVILLPSDYAKLGTSVAWQAVFGANVHFWRNTGYFGIAAEREPLLHTWSLALEEQFYMVVPLLLMAVFRIPQLRERRHLIAFFIAGSLTSLAAAAYGVARAPSATFFLLPTRAWELLLGGLVAVLPLSFVPRRAAWRNVLTLTGLAGIIVPAFVYSRTTPFPGIAAIPPCLGTALFVWASSAADGDYAVSRPWAARILAARPVVFVGLISYSLYLWHWPFLVFGSYWSIDSISAPARAALVSASAGAALLSWRWIETPFREKRVSRSRHRMFAVTAAGMALLLIGGEAVSRGGGVPGRFSALTVSYARAAEDTAGIHEVTAADVARDNLPALGRRDSNLPVTLLLWGDSHAMAAAPAFDKFLNERGLAGRQATASATAPVTIGYWQNEFTTPASVAAFNEAVVDYVERHHVPIVVLAGFWEYYTDARGQIPLDSALLVTIRKLEEIGSQPYLLLQVPHPPFDVPHALAMSSIFGRDLEGRLATPAKWNGLRGAGTAVLDSLQNAGSRILDPRPAFLDSSRRHFVIARNGFPLYRDAHHLSAAGAELILVPLLRASVETKPM